MNCSKKFFIDSHGFHSITDMGHVIFLHLILCRMDGKIELHCPLCTEKFTIIARYIGHAEAHHPSPRQDYLCPVCPSEQYPRHYRRRTLEEHLRATHRKKSTTNVKCKDCALLVSITDIKSHLEGHVHQVCKFSCPHPNCDAVFKSANLKKKFGQVYSRHNSDAHKNSFSDVKRPTSS